MSTPKREFLLLEPISFERFQTALLSTTDDKRRFVLRVREITPGDNYGLEKNVECTMRTIGGGRNNTPHHVTGTLVNGSTFKFSGDITQEPKDNSYGHLVAS